MWRAWVWLDASRLRRSAWCAQQDPGWPLAADSGYADASALCAALAALPATLRLYVHALPRSVASVGVLPLFAPYFNRGYPVEAYLLRNMARGPFTTRDATAANAFLLPMAPYSLRVAAFPGDGLLGVQARVAAAVEAVKASAPAVWAAHAACDHVLVSAHDKGGRVAQTADRALIDHAVLIVNTADTHGDANEWRVAISACQCFTDASACCFADLTSVLPFREQGPVHKGQGCGRHLQLLHRAAGLGRRAGRVRRPARRAARPPGVLRRRRPGRRAAGPLRALRAAAVAGAAGGAPPPGAQGVHARPPHLKVLPGEHACAVAVLAFLAFTPHVASSDAMHASA